MPGPESLAFSQLPLLTTHPRIQPYILVFLAVLLVPPSNVRTIYTDYGHTATKSRSQDSNLDSLAPHVCYSHYI